MKFSPYINSQVIIKNGEKLEGGIIFGVNLDDEIQINSVLKSGVSDANLSNFGAIIGKGNQRRF